MNKNIKSNAGELIDNLITSLPDWRGRTLSKIREIILNSDAKIIEEWKWRGAPVWSYEGIICLANAFKDKIKVTFPNGASLDDTNKVFNNGLEGNKWRTIDLYEGDEIDEKALTSLVHSAIDYNLSKTKQKN